MKNILLITACLIGYAGYASERPLWDHFEYYESDSGDCEGRYLFVQPTLNDSGQIISLNIYDYDNLYRFFKLFEAGKYEGKEEYSYCGSSSYWKLEENKFIIKTTYQSMDYSWIFGSSCNESSRLEVQFKKENSKLIIDKYETQSSSKESKNSECIYHLVPNPRDGK